MDPQRPQKPWERRIPGAMSAPVNYRSVNLAPPVGPSVSVGPPVLTRMAPPVPPRSVQQAYRPSYSSFSSSYSPYGSSIYGGSSMYGGYSPYSYGGGFGVGGYGRLPHTEEVAPSRFVQQAEESSRGAFQSIESIVQAFSSVSMMLDATFSAVYNSFRAVLDVANHLTRLRAHLTRVLSAFALVRTLRYLYRRLQRLLGQRSDTEVEDLWADSTSDTLTAAGGAEHHTPKSWPIFLFFAVVLGGPYLIWKLLSSSPAPEEQDSNWASGEDDHVVARAEFDFSAASEEEITLRAGDMMNLAPKELQPRVRGWLLASVDGQTSGLVPANYVKVLGKRRGRRHAETERLAQLQQENTHTVTHTHPAPQITPTPGQDTNSEELLDVTGVYKQSVKAAELANVSIARSQPAEQQQLHHLHPDIIILTQAQAYFTGPDKTTAAMSRFCSDNNNFPYDNNMLVLDMVLGSLRGVTPPISWDNVAKLVPGFTPKEVALNSGLGGGLTHVDDQCNALTEVSPAPSDDLSSLLDCGGAEETGSSLSGKLTGCKSAASGRVSSVEKKERRRSSEEDDKTHRVRE
ncbi:LOW QUALITY PROTEIN: peroxisome biogenesis factor 13 [Tautogolabrus adspersus]